MPSDSTSSPFPCSFCRSKDVHLVYRGKPTVVTVPGAKPIELDGDWLICRECYFVISFGLWERLERRSYQSCRHEIPKGQHQLYKDCILLTVIAFQEAKAEGFTAMHPSRWARLRGVA